MTATHSRIYLFLSNCRINDLDTVLGYIFRLPIAEAFSNRQVWTHDMQILAEVKLIGKTGRQAGVADTDDRPIPTPVVFERPAPARHEPRPLTLFLAPQQDVQP